jgi:hypothetical protein
VSGLQHNEALHRNEAASWRPRLVSGPRWRPSAARSRVPLSARLVYVTLLRTRPAFLLAIILMPLVHSICAAGSSSEAAMPNEVASDSANDRILYAASGPRLCLADEA